MSIYVLLTRQFNAGSKTRAVLSSGQAAVLHRVAIMSKDGDWILREDDESMGHVLRVLAGYKARYRFGAPLDIRWLRGGWSAHFEFQNEDLRVRTDFVTRPPRLDDEALRDLWLRQEGRDLPVIDIPDLIEIKKTRREKDYPIIGELARRLSDPQQQILFSRSSLDLMALADTHGELVQRLMDRRPVLRSISEGRDALEAALDAERRALSRTDEKRLMAYMRAAAPWGAIWHDVAEKTRGLNLAETHERIVDFAEATLPFSPGEA